VHTNAPTYIVCHHEHHYFDSKNGSKITFLRPDLCRNQSGFSSRRRAAAVVFLSVGQLRNQNITPKFELEPADFSPKFRRDLPLSALKFVSHLRFSGVEITNPKKGNAIFYRRCCEFRCFYERILTGFGASKIGFPGGARSFSEVNPRQNCSSPEAFSDDFAITFQRLEELLSLASDRFLQS